MKNSSTYYLIFLLIAAQRIFSQDTICEVLENENLRLNSPTQRMNAVGQITGINNEKRNRALERARSLGLDSRIELHDGGLRELVDFDEEGKPLYLSTFNSTAAISTAANLARTAHAVEGNGVTIGMWDGGSARSTHQEFGSRMIVKDGSTAIAHATHVGGTMIASGITASARGMASAATCHSYDWTNDIAEMTARAASSVGQADMIYLSNHSYGYTSGWASTGTSSPAWTWYGNGNTNTSSAFAFGQYGPLVREVDLLAYNAPYYLMFQAAGNDRVDNPNNGQTVQLSPGGANVIYDNTIHPNGDGFYRGGYDSMSYRALAKNLVSIGAVNDAVSGGFRNVAAATMTTLSSWGPTDDGRIKPDLVANGAIVYSTFHNSDTAYGTMSGTSMASPNAAGSAALLIDHYENLFRGQMMRASTLKGLLIHTADDLGNAGPDYRNGWGLVNTLAAADLISAHHSFPNQQRIKEAELTTAVTTRTYSVLWDGNSPLRATLSWTDPAGSTTTTNDSRLPRLVNNLNLRIIDPNGNTYLPYIMPFVGTWTQASMDLPATTGDNDRDNIEQVYLPNPTVPGTYRIVVSYSGALTNNQQVFSLLLSGTSAEASPPSISSLSPSAIEANTNLVNLTLSGSSFATGAQVTFSRFGSQDRIASVQSVSSESISCSLNMAGMQIGMWNVTVVNPDSKTATLTNGFEVLTPPPLSLMAVSPNKSLSGGIANIDLTGDALVSVNQVRLVRAGQSDIIASGLQMTGGILRCQVNLTNASSGLWSIVASSPSETASLNNAFNVLATLWSENFDNTVTGWSSTSATGSNSWGSSSSVSYSPSISRFISAPSTKTTTWLVSPSVAIPANASNLELRFWQNFNLTNPDGARFELSIDNGSWFDVTSLNSGVSFLQSPYNTTISSSGSVSSRSDFAAMIVWSGNSGGFIQTIIQLSDTSKFAGKNLRLRWGLATNSSTSSSGWYVDSVAILGVIPPVISQATLSLSELSQVYTGAQRPISVETSPANLSNTVTYNGSSVAPTNAGEYVVAATITDANYQGSATGALVISKASATLSLSNLAQTFTGSVLAVSAETSPANLSYTVTYNGSTVAPTNAGEYAVVATITDANYQGSASGILTISMPNFNDWKLANFSAAQIANGEGAMEADPEGDTLSNFMEYALGTSPLEPSDKPITIIEADSLGILRYTLKFTRPSALSDVEYFVEICSDFNVRNWIPIQTLEVSPILGSSNEQVIARDPLIFEDVTNAQRFIRLRVNQR